MENPLFNFLSKIDDPVIATDGHRILYMNDSFHHLFDNKHQIKNLRIDEFIKNKKILTFLRASRSDIQTPFIGIDTCVVSSHPDPIQITWCILPFSLNETTHWKLCIAQLPSSMSFNKESLKLKSEIKNILDCTPGKLYWKDKDSHYMGANKEWLELIQRDSVDQIIGKRDEEFFGDQAEALRENDRWVMATKETLTIEEAVELPSGELRYFIATKMPRYNAEGVVIGVMGNSIDITDRKKLEEELKISKQKAEAASAAKSEFIANMAHGTPRKCVNNLKVKVLPQKLTRSTEYRVLGLQR